MKNLQLTLTHFVLAAAISSNLVLGDTNTTETNDEHHGEISAANFTILILPETISTTRVKRSVIPRSLQVSNFHASWQDALIHCYDMDTILVSIENREVDLFIRKVLLSNRLTGQPLWTSGVQAHGFTSSWVWAGSGQKVTYTNWSPFTSQSCGYSCGEGFSRDCLSTRLLGFSDADYKWDPENCERELRFLCAKF